MLRVPDLLKNEKTFSILCENPAECVLLSAFSQQPAPFLYFFIALNNCGTASKPKKRPFKQGFSFFIHVQVPCQKTVIISKHQQPKKFKPLYRKILFRKS